MTMGSGILPVIDLLDFLYKKAMYLVLSYHKEDTSFIRPKQDYSQILFGARFRLYCSFSNISEFSGWQWISKLAQLSQEYNMGLFECVANVNTDSRMGGIQVTNQKFDSEFLRRELIERQFDKFWVCGNHKFNSQIGADAVKVGVDENNIVFI